MSGQRAYLDHNATSVLRPSAREAMMMALSTGNASSVHAEGRDARRLVEKARAQVAALVNVDVDGVIFTAGATEAAHLGLTPNINSDGVGRPASTLYVPETEHPCILAGGRFASENVQTIAVNRSGVADLEDLKRLLDAHDFDRGLPFVAVQLVNSETGVIQPVAEIARMVRFRGGYVLCDAVQAVGRMPVDAGELGIDFLILSSHKIGGPQGAGALVICHPILAVDAAVRGGGQEKNRRAGTENVAAIVGFGAAAGNAARDAADFGSVSALRDSIIGRLQPICSANGLSENLTVFGSDAPRVGNTLLFGLEGLRAETALIAFDLEGVAVSSGSACSSGKVGKSHVLEAMDVPPALARGAVRVSLGWNTCADDIDRFVTAFERIAKRLAEMLNKEIAGAA